MSKELYEQVLCCPACRGPITFNTEISCNNQQCRKKYNVLDDIPVMLDGDANEIKEQITEARNTGGSMFDRNILGVPYYKISHYVKKFLYESLRIKLPKLKDQRDYWLQRGTEYCQEFQRNGNENMEIFFQDMAIEELRKLEFESIFEAGCGFGWNIQRFKREFPDVRVGGLDFSHTQLLNGKDEYIRDDSVLLTEGDATRMPFKDNAYDVGFSLGVFMNINAKKIGTAIDEMVRVCRKYIVHLEYDEANTTDELKRRRVFKTNIISHDYRSLYEQRGLKVLKVISFKDFSDEYESFAHETDSDVDRWEQWEGPGKYVLVIVENQMTQKDTSI